VLKNSPGICTLDDFWNALPSKNYHLWATFYEHGVNYDSNPPTVTITSGPSGITKGDVSFTWTGSDDYTSASDLLYSYYLEGYDSGWSSWTSNTSKTYNGLPAGKSYTFRVKAKDKAGNVGPESNRSFTVYAEVCFYPLPSGSGTIVFNNKVYSSGCDLYNVGTYSAEASPSSGGWTFDMWESGVASKIYIHDPSSRSTLVDVGGDGNLIAKFDALVTFYTNPQVGGSITVSGSGKGTGTYYNGQQGAFDRISCTDCYTITANAPPGHSFAGWSTTGYVSVGDSSKQSTNLVVNGPGTITVNWWAQVTVDPNGGRIYVDNSPITSAQTYSWAYNSQHTLDPDSGYQPSSGVRKIFTQWSDGSTADPRTITVTSSATYTAYWKTQYQLTISSSDGGTTNPAPGSYWYDSGSSVSVTAIASSGYKFDHWELDGTNVGSANPYTVNMDKPHTLKAVFTASTSFDDKDGKKDLRVFRPSNGYWYALLSSNNYDRTKAFSIQWGVNGDVPFIGDIDGDGKADAIIFRPSNGYWYALLSGNNYDRMKPLTRQWGTSGDVPLVGDIDGDGRADLIVWRPSNGYWYVLLSSTNYDRTKPLTRQWGTNEDKPLIGDIDGDGKADLIIWRPSNGYWYALLSGTGYDRMKPLTRQWGTNGDIPLIGDLDKDGRADIMVFRPSNGYWYALLSSVSYDRTKAFSKQWGTSGDRPLIGDIDGDGKADIMVWRQSNGYWYALLSGKNYDRTQAFSKQWGTSGDVPT